jgi:hypothetical protein
MNYHKNCIVVTYTHETWGNYTEAKFYNFQEALEFSEMLLSDFDGYSIFSIETKTK